MKTYNLFISHSWAYSDNYERLTNLLRNRKYFTFKDYSVPKDDPIHTQGSNAKLYSAIYEKMKPCSVVIILAGVYATYSKWINNEIKIAKNEFIFQKPIIAIEPWGSKKTSSIVKQNADLIVGWNKDSVVSAIKELA